MKKQTKTESKRECESRQQLEESEEDKLQVVVINKNKYLSVVQVKKLLRERVREEMNKIVQVHERDISLVLDVIETVAGKYGKKTVSGIQQSKAGEKSEKSGKSVESATKKEKRPKADSNLLEDRIRALETQFVKTSKLRIEEEGEEKGERGKGEQRQGREKQKERHANRVQNKKKSQWSALNPEKPERREKKSALKL